LSEGEDAQKPESGIQLVVNETSLMELPRKLLGFINRLPKPERKSLSEMDKELGFRKGHAKSIVNPGTQKLVKLSIDEISKIAVFSRGVAQHLSDPADRAHIVHYCNELAQRIHERLERGGISLTANTFVTNLRLDDNEQQTFSDQHAGVYALIRLDREAHILISRMDVHAREAQLCRFATESPGSELSEPSVEGFIYSIGGAIQAVGRPTSRTPFRTSILRSRGGEDPSNQADMIGLRLGVSNYDGGPFAYRIYCRRIAGSDQVGSALPDWADLFGGRHYEEAAKLEPKIGDIQEILRLLRQHDPQTPWGVRIPIDIFEETRG
jgi:hypothetical protein